MYKTVQVQTIKLLIKHMYWLLTKGFNSVYSKQVIVTQNKIVRIDTNKELYDSII